MRKIVALCAVACLAVAGCDSGDDPGPTSPPGADPVEITLQVSGEPEETAVYRTLAAEYQKTNDDAVVQVVEVPDGDEHLAKLATSFAGGTPPDVFLINYREYAQFAVRDAVAPIEDLLLDNGLDLSEYYPQSLDAFTLDGTLQCMPQNISSLVVYYNTNLFRRAGIEPPREGWSFDEFEAAARELTSGGVDGLGVDPQVIRLAPFVWSNGGEITDDPDAPARFTFDDPAAREVVEAFARLARDEVVPTPDELAAQDLETRFMKGRVAMLLSSRRDTPVFREVTDFAWDVLPLPAFEEPASILHSDALCVAAESDAVEEAGAFVAYAMGEEGQTLTALSGRTVPSMQKVAESAAFLDPSQRPAHSEVWLEAIPHIRNTPVISTWPEIEAVSEELLTRLFYEEGFTVDDFLRELDAQTTPLFEEAE